MLEVNRNNSLIYSRSRMYGSGVSRESTAKKSMYKDFINLSLGHRRLDVSWAEQVERQKTDV